MEKLDLTQILKYCPVGTKLYSPLFGDAFFEICDIPTQVKVRDNKNVIWYFRKDGKYYNIEESECILFPSKDNRDWSTFKTEQQRPKFEPFQKVLVRNSDNNWRIGFFDFEGGPVERHHYYVIGRDFPFDQCIPYEGNEHLLGTNKDHKLTEE